MITHAAISLIQEIVGEPPLVAIDQEGGIVQRLKEGLTPIPGAMAQSAAVLGGGIWVSDVEELGHICASELASLGVNWNLSPVADVNVNPSNPVIGVRSYGDDPGFVATMASAFARGLEAGGVAATAKHFPGHGDTSLDSHKALPIVSHGMERLNAVELVPFKRLIGQGIPTVMTSHVRFPAVEPEDLPATLSYRVLTGLLRGQLGFNGVICTDCMEMDAIQKYYSDPYARAIEAGADMLIISHRADRQAHAAESIYTAVREGRISEKRIDESFARIHALKDRYARQIAGATVPSDTGRKNRSVAERISRASITSIPIEGACSISRSTSLGIAGKGMVLVDIAPVNATGAEDSDNVPSLRMALARLGSEAVVLRCPPEFDDIQVRETGERISALFSGGNCDRLVFAVDGPFLRHGRSDLLVRCAEIAQRYSVSFHLLLMRSPYDAPVVVRLLRSKNLSAPEIFCAYEYSELSTTIVADFLSGRLEARGVCPAHLSWETPGDTAGIDVIGGKE